MNCARGDVVPLYHVFTDDDTHEHVTVDTAEVRVMHEQGDNVYEDMPWATMKSFADGFAAAFDTGEYVEADGDYVVVYRGHAGDKVYTASEVITVGDVPLPQAHGVRTVRLFGYTVDGGKGKLLGNVEVTVRTPGGQLVISTQTDYSGRWEANVQPGEYMVSFAATGFGSREARVQVGDTAVESQFANMTMEPDNESFRGPGVHRVSDIFTDKHDMGIAGMQLAVSTAVAPDQVIGTCVTTDKGEWRLNLDQGEYLLRVTLPAGTTKVFRLLVNADGGHQLVEYRTSVVPAKTDSEEQEVLSNGNGEVAVHDLVLNSHGVGIPNVVVKAYKYMAVSEQQQMAQQTTTATTTTTVTTDGTTTTTTSSSSSSSSSNTAMPQTGVSAPKFVYVAGDMTTSVGEFNLNLDHGQYRLTFDVDGFKHFEQIVNV